MITGKTYDIRSGPYLEAIIGGGGVYSCSHTVKQSLSKEIRRAEHESGPPREFARPRANPLWRPHA